MQLTKTAVVGAAFALASTSASAIELNEDGTITQVVSNYSSVSNLCSASFRNCLSIRAVPNGYEVTWELVM